MSRTAASLSFTIGVAVATLLVAGGILVGPAVLACSRDASTVGSCLRSKATDAGLIHAPAVVDAKAPSRPDGWLAADATEYTAPPAAAASLAAGGGDIVAGGTAAPLPALSGQAEISLAPGTLAATASAPSAPAPVEVALAEPPVPTGQGTAGTASAAGASSYLVAPRGSLAVDGAAPLVPAVKADAAMAADLGTLSADGSAPAGVSTPGRSLMVAAPGGLAAAGTAPSSAPQAVAKLSPAIGQVLAAGSVQSAPPLGQSSLQAPPPLPVPAPTLKAELSSVSSIEQVAPQPVLIRPETMVAAPGAPVHKSASIAKAPPLRPIPKYDPRFPNVIVLPPPNSGADSSITSLELR